MSARSEIKPLPLPNLGSLSEHLVTLEAMILKSHQTLAVPAEYLASANLRDSYWQSQCRWLDQMNHALAKRLLGNPNLPKASEPSAAPLIVPPTSAS